MNSVLLQDQQSYYFPMSFAQQRLWLFQQMQPGSTAYNITGALRFSGNLDVVALEQALQKIVQRHEILRTTFRNVRGEPSQWVQPEVNLILEKQVLAEAGLSEQLQTCRQIAAKLAAHVFDLEAGPLIRLQLLTLTPGEYVLLSVVHHIISDGWSMGVFVDEIMKFYVACQQGMLTTNLPELEIQYGDYALWQRDWFSGDVRARQMDYWQKQLAGMPSLIALPTDFPRPPVQRFQGATKTAQLSKQTTAALRILANQENATMNMVLLTVYFILLHRYNQEQDLVVGTPVANRNQHALEPLIGFFANTLVLRAQIDPQSSFRMLLQHVKAISLAAFDHQDCPFEQLVDQLRPERSLSYSPLIQTLFTYQTASEQAFTLPNVSISHLQLERNNAQFDLALMASENTNDISLEFGFNTDLFKPDTIGAMAQHFVNTCQAVVVNPELKCGTIPLMDSDEYDTVLEAWNQGQSVELEECNVMLAIERQAFNNPEAIAVVCNEHSLSYSALLNQSRHIAQLLLNAGVNSGDLVGLCIEPCVDMLVAMLAIIKAGAAYVPMDPYYPEQRLKLIAESAGIKHLVSQRHLASMFNTVQSDDQFDLYFIEDLLSTESVPQDLPVLKGEQLIYMIFTSGSTGVPKGAAVQHQSFANLVLNWYVPEYALSEAKSTLVCTSLSFDLTQKNFFAPLVVGGTVYLYGQREYDPLAIIHLIDRYQIAWINTTPSAFYPLTDAAASQPENLASLKHVFLGGETISLGRMQPWLDTAKQTTQIINSYGPTECTDVCMYFTISPIEEYFEKAVPLGAAIDNARLYVVDDALNPLPFGVPGELCVGGLGVGVGYLNDTERSAERFLPDPFSQQAGSRLYRTGDQVRFTAERGFEFLCRTDHQVKVRGFRIDLGEIELSLNSHQLIQAAVVTANENDRQESYLTAYLVARNTLELKEIRDYVAQRLPHYMVPQKWLIMDQLPLTPSGKVDRQALPDNAEDLIEDSGAIQVPNNEIERKLLEIWQQVLQLSGIGTQHNFFDLGGHSLTATQIVSRIKQEFNLDMPIRVIFEKPSIIQQAEWILSAQFEGYDDAEQMQLLDELMQLSDDEVDSETE